MLRFTRHAAAASSGSATGDGYYALIEFAFGT